MLYLPKPRTMEPKPPLGYPPEWLTGRPWTWLQRAAFLAKGLWYRCQLAYWYLAWDCKGQVERRRIYLERMRGNGQWWDD